MKNIFVIIASMFALISCSEKNDEIADNSNNIIINDFRLSGADKSIYDDPDDYFFKTGTYLGIKANVKSVRPIKKVQLSVNFLNEPSTIVWLFDLKDGEDYMKYFNIISEDYTKEFNGLKKVHLDKNILIPFEYKDGVKINGIKGNDDTARPYYIELKIIDDYGLVKCKRARLDISNVLH